MGYGVRWQERAGPERSTQGKKEERMGSKKGEENIREPSETQQKGWQQKMPGDSRGEPDLLSLGGATGE